MSQINRWMLAAIPAAICSIQVMAAPAWNSATAYTGGQSVTYAGQDYKAKWWTQNNVPGTEQWGPWELVGTGTATPVPTLAPTATPIITAAPTATAKPTSAPTTAPTATPVTGSCGTEWNSATAYQGGQRVVYNNTNYEAKWWVQGTAPSSTEQWGPWKNLGACSGGVQPTASPTAKPTATPVVTIAPTASPKPTATPVVTVAPTASPTPVVTVAPTPTATPVVTTSPTATP
ncbi:MAG: carbohydrate-binding protein, partial [Deefgea sp.]